MLSVRSAWAILALSITMVACLQAAPPSSAAAGLATFYVLPEKIAAGSSGTGTILLTEPAPPPGVSVAISSSQPAAASAPQTVTVPAGQATVRFPVATAPVNSKTFVTFAATYAGVTKESGIAVTPGSPTPTTDGILSSFYVLPERVPAGSTATGTIILASPAPDGGVAVQISASQPCVSAPAVVTVPAGQTTAQFQVDTTDVPAKTFVTFAATCGGVRKESGIAVVPKAPAAPSSPSSPPTPSNPSAPPAPPSKPDAPSSPPPPPTGLAATAGDGTVSLSWDAVPGASGYDVARSTVAGGPYAVVVQGLTSTTFTNSDLINGTTYRYVVTATNSAGTSQPSAEAAATPGSSRQLPDLGPDASLHGWRPFPDDNPWNTPIDNEPVDPNSDALIASIGASVGLHPDFGTVWAGAPNGIPYVVVSGSQPKVPVSFRYYWESDPGPYPVPPDAPIEGGPNGTGDRHVLVVDRDNWMLYELFNAAPNGDGSWTASSGAIFNLNSNEMRPDGWTSADAAGLPVFPGLVRYDEVVEQGEIRHALRFTAQRTRKAYVYPARHAASWFTDPSLPPMGMRVRLKASYDISRFPPHIQVILRALKKYGMILADNGGNWFISGAPDPRWSEDELSTLRLIRGSAFEVVKMGPVTNG